MTVIEGICTKCKKPFIWLILLFESGVDRSLVCPHCGSKEVMINRHDNYYKQFVSRKASSENPLIIDKKWENSETLTSTKLNGLIDEYVDKYGWIPPYILVSRIVRNKYSNYFIDDITEVYPVYRYENHRIWVKVAGNQQ